MSAKGVSAPRLPAAPEVYNAQFMDATLNILRQYFNQLGAGGPIATATQRRSASEIIAAISCSQPNPATGVVSISMPTQADFANLRSGDIYMDTSGGAASSYPLRIKA
jgi:hypothetical protein